MFEGIPAWVLNDMTPWGLVGFMVICLMTGRVIVPRFYYKELLDDRNRWRAVAESQTASVAEFAGAMPGLVEIGKTTDKLMSSIKEKSSETAQ